MHSVLFDRNYHQNKCEEKTVWFWISRYVLFYNFPISIFAKANCSRSHYLKFWMYFITFYFFIRLLQTFFREINFCQIKHCGGAHLRKNLLIQCVRRETSFFFPLFLLFRASFIADLFSICSTITPSFYNHFIFFLKDFFFVLL